MQHYVIKFVSDLQQVDGFLRVRSSNNKTDCHGITEILLKVFIRVFVQLYHGVLFYVDMVALLYNRD
jgi:hypothetical protein